MLRAQQVASSSNGYIPLEFDSKPYSTGGDESECEAYSTGGNESEL